MRKSVIITGAVEDSSILEHVYNNEERLAETPFIKEVTCQIFVSNDNGISYEEKDWLSKLENDTIEKGYVNSLFNRRMSKEFLENLPYTDVIVLRRITVKNINTSRTTYSDVKHACIKIDNESHFERRELFLDQVVHMSDAICRNTFNYESPSQWDVTVIKIIDKDGQEETIYNKDVVRGIKEISGKNLPIRVGRKIMVVRKSFNRGRVLINYFTQFPK